jgi:lipoprotein NlpD
MQPGERLFSCSAIGRLGVAVIVLALGACSAPVRKAPVEERSIAAKPAATAPASAPVPAVPPVDAPAPAAASLGVENAGKPGFYTVKPGDTVLRIALEHGQNWRDVVRWNNLDNPNVVEVGQVLRVQPPPPDAAVTGTRPVTGADRVETRPLEPRPAAAAVAPPPGAVRPPATTAAPGSAPPPAAPSAPSATPPAPQPAPAATAPPPAATDTAPATREADEIVWIWPATGAVLAAFDEGRNKGLTIGGKAGDPVLAASDGRVVYAGSSLRGYGNLVIVKHSETYLTAYAHNQTLLVKDDQVVRRGQKIAEMGSSDAQRVQLHFEIRRQGKPVDPAKLLPPR